MTSRTDTSPLPALSYPQAWMVFGFGTVLSGAMFLAFPDDVGTKVLAMSLLVLISAMSVRFELSHPFVWFGLSVLLYSISGPLLAHLGIHPLPTRSVFLIEELDFSFAMDIQYMALLAALLIIGPGQVSFASALNDPRREAVFAGVNMVLILTAAVAAISIVAIVTSGFANKREIILHGEWTTRLSFGFNMLATCVGVYLIRNFVESRHKQAYIFIGVIFVVGFIVVLYAGQRNFMFRVLIVAAIAVHIAHHRISIAAMLPLGIASSVLIWIMNPLKNTLLQGADHDLSGVNIENLLAPMAYDYLAAGGDSAVTIFMKGVLLMALGSEFMTSGNNLALLTMRVPHEIPFQYGATLINDLVRSVTPGFITIGSVAVHDAQNTVTVFNRLFFPEGFYQGNGQGFSFIGTGYFNFGIAGAILIMLLLGGAIRFFYRWAARSPFGLFFYIGFIPVAMFTGRSDLATPISQGIKHVAVPLVMMLFIYMLSVRKTAGLDRRASLDRRAAGSATSRISGRERRSKTSDRRERSDRRLNPRTSSKDRGRIPEGPGDEPEAT